MHQTKLTEETDPNRQSQDSVYTYALTQAITVGLMVVHMGVTATRDPGGDS